MEKENVVYTHREYFLTIKIMNLLFVTTWRKVEDIVK
jgi:hypothetical protein